ncbi:MAG: hypothetical protein AB1330_06315 [Bacillota bacterium]
MWTDIHQWFAVVFLVLIVVHIYRRWSLVRVMTRRVFRQKTRY